MSAERDSPVEVCDQIKASVNEAYEVIEKFLMRPDRESQAVSDEVRAKLHALRQKLLDYEPVLDRLANQISEHAVRELRQIVRKVHRTVDERLKVLPGGADAMINTCSPKQHENALAFAQIVRNIELATVEFNTVLAQVRRHQECIAKERAALGDLRERLVRLLTLGREWRTSLWALTWRGGISPDAYRSAELKNSDLNSQIDRVVWQLFDFRKAGEEEDEP
jgi:DNA repair ATPase RecN